MDLDDFWQENKRWILGCVAGLLVFVIANSILADSGRRRGGATLKGPYYTQKQLNQIKKDSETLTAKLVSLRKALHFELPESYVRQGDPDLFWTTTYDRVSRELSDLATAANVEFPSASFAWTASDAATQERSLVGCAVVEHLVKQLIAAHRTVIDDDLDAIGLRTIGSFTLDRARGKRRFRRREDDPIRPEELLDEVKVTFKFEADHPTAHRFLENCRDSALRVGLGGLKIVHGRDDGDPLTITGEAIALTIKPIPTEDL